MGIDAFSPQNEVQLSVEIVGHDVESLPIFHEPSEK